MLQDFIALIQGLQGNPISGPVFVLLYAGACFVAPVSIFPVAGGVLFGFWRGLVINLFSALLGASGAFFLARWIGHGRLARWLHRLERNRPFLHAIEDPDPGAFIILRLLGFPPFVITNYLAGLSVMRWRRFLWTSAVGLLPWTFVMTYFADTLWAVLLRAGLAGFRRAFLEYGRPLLGGVLILTAVAVLGIWLHRRGERRRLVLRVRAER